MNWYMIHQAILQNDSFYRVVFSPNFFVDLLKSSILVRLEEVCVLEEDSMISNYSRMFEARQFCAKGIQIPLPPLRA